MTTDQPSDQPTLLHALCDLGETLVQDFDIVDFLTRVARWSVDLTPATTAGIVLDDQRGRLRVVASTREHTRLLALFEVQSLEGPCQDVYRSGLPVGVVRLVDRTSQWPTVATEALRAGLGATCAYPLRLRDTTIGALNLFGDADLSLSEGDVAAIEALANTATTGLLNHADQRRAEQVAEELLVTVNSRITIEQAKGVVAERMGVDMVAAFAILQTLAEERRQPLTAVSAEVVSGRLIPTASHVETVATILATRATRATSAATRDTAQAPDSRTTASGHTIDG